MKKIRLGSGAGYSGDRIEPAVKPIAEALARPAPAPNLVDMARGQ